MQPCGEALADVSRHRPSVVRWQNSAVVRRPGENFLVIRSREIRFLDANQIQISLAAKEPTHNPAVEIFIGQEPNHVSLLWEGVWKAGEFEYPRDQTPFRFLRASRGRPFPSWKRKRRLRRDDANNN
jgi:hypothetical protein